MREVLNTTVALWQVMQHYQRGYTVSIAFVTDSEKVLAKSLQWERDFGTRLLSYQKQDRKQRGLPTAVALSTQVHGSPSKRELILMATPLALSAHPDSPWAKQKWMEQLPQCGVYIMVRSPRLQGGYSWTWNLQERVRSQLSARLTHLVKSKNAFAVRSETESWTQIFSMYRGVRGQLIRAIKSAQKLWHACHGSSWPGIDPKSLPCITEFRRQQA
ncbi:MAG: hypothetical protein O9341_06495 [Paucibacter sp.]|nr:hypothetical protein [Roseateles sp.]